MKPRYFAPYELVSKAIYNSYDNKNDIYNLFDPKVLVILDWIRDLVGAPIIVNNWKAGGSLQNRGYRAANSTVGAAKSAHKEGKAIDFSCAKYTANQIREFIMANLEDLPYSIRLESGLDAPTWVHFDTRLKQGQSKIYVFRA